MPRLTYASLAVDTSGTLNFDECRIKISINLCFPINFWQIRIMKTAIKPVILILFNTLLEGCAGMRGDLVLDTVSPSPAPSIQSNSSPGILIVYSAGKVNADFNSRDPNRREYSDYRILNRKKIGSSLFLVE
jgi:hypothetical protein